MQERAERWASTMAGRDRRGGVRLAHADSRGRASSQPGSTGVARQEHEHEALATTATRAVGAGDRAAARGARCVAHLLRARPRPHPPRHRVPPAGRQDAGVRVPRRPPAHPAHPRPRGGPGRHVGRPGARAQRRPHRGHRPRPRLRPRPRRPRQRGRARRRTSTAATTTPCGAPTSRWPRSTCAPRRSTASATTRGAARRRPRRRARSCRGPTASPTSATTSRTPSPPASSPPTMLPAVVAERCGTTPLPPARHVHPGDGRRRGRDRPRRDDRAGGRGAGRVPPVQLRARLPAPGQPGPGRRPSSSCCGRWSSTTPTGPTCCPTRHVPLAAATRPSRAAVAYVAGMTDRFACRQAVALLGWDPAKLPVGVT